MEKIVMSNPICEVCNKNESFAVISVPGVPISCAYCKECYEVGAHPFYVLIANTACCGGMKYCIQWWRDEVAITLKYLNKTQEWFDAEVEKSVEAIKEYARDGV